MQVDVIIINKKEIKKLNSLPIRQSVIQTRTEPHLNQSIDDKYTHLDNQAMDQDNRQGGGFDPSNPGAPGQFFFNAQQQPQQLFQNQFLQQQVGAGNP